MFGSETPLQDPWDAKNARMQKARAETQLTLGGLIKILEEMSDGALVANLSGVHSYRGYYSDLAFRRGEGKIPAANLLAECRGAMGREFQGYKGGYFLMGEATPLWVAQWGSCGERLIDVREGGEVVTAEDGEP